ncbi:MAG: sterol desaturase family protein [Actinobacteria bacterium]|jgi:hypothetical protein|nr:sterol desaturase family protein [Actinomycetota bacterium]
MGSVANVAGVVGFAALGAFAWTFAEYWLHLSFHVRKGWGFDSRAHLDHHVHASWHFDPIITLAWAGVLAAGWGLARLFGLFVWAPFGFGFGGGWVVGYFFYEWHHAQSHLRAPRNRWEVWLRKHHLQHHFGRPMHNQGVTIPLWDIVFRTRDQPERVRVPRRLAANAVLWLTDDSGNIRPEYAEDYELVGSIEAESERQAGIDRARAYANLEPIA